MIIAPPGTGKSTDYIKSPMDGMVLTTPTHLLKHGHIDAANHWKSDLKVETGHKVCGLNMMDLDTYRLTHYSCTVIDEITMYTKDHGERMLEYAEEMGSQLIVLGDPEQIHCSVGGAPIDQDFFDKFIRFEIAREPNKPARHEYEYGCKLDALRGKNRWEQAKMITEMGFQTIAQDDIKFEKGVHIVTGSHQKVHEFNQLAKKHMADSFPLRFVAGDLKGHIFYTSLDSVPEDHIFWNRVSVMSEPPPGTRYEPAFALTADAFQGQTVSEGKLLIDVNGLKSRHGLLYTAVTRPKKQEQILLL